jgi:putative membrane protein
MHSGYGYGYNGDAHPWLWVLMVVAMFVFVAAAAWIVVTLVRHRDGPGAAGAATGSPPAGPLSDGRRILDERFARGDIDEDEYRRRRSVIEGDG